MKAYYHPQFRAPIGSHIMPMQKFEQVAAALTNWKELQLVAPEPITSEDLLRVHASTYIDAVRTGEPKALAESQKFPWSPELFPSVCLTSGGVLAAATTALEEGSSAALASGFHHSHQERGEGFCTFNGLVVAIDALRARGLIRHAAILDMDLHYGNGTALLAKDRPWIRALSLYGNDYWNNTAYRDVTTCQHEDGPNHWSAPLPAGCDRETLLQIMDVQLPKLLKDSVPDLLLYQAGADPYFEDPYSPLSLNHADLKARDVQVFTFAKAHQIPIAWVLAGGYTKDLSKIVQVHVNTFEAWKEVYLSR